MQSGLELQLLKERRSLGPASTGRQFAPDERVGVTGRKVRAAWIGASTLGILRCAQDDGIKQVTIVVAKIALSKRMKRCLCLLLCSVHAAVAMASEHHGQIVSGGFPVPGVTVTATQAGKKFVTSTDLQGNYAFADLPDGSWKFALTMTGFTEIDQDVTIVPNAPGIQWELKMLPLDTMIAQTKVVKAAPVAVAATTAAPTPKTADTSKPPPEPAQDSSDGFLVNGSVNNAATSPFSQRPAFGNQRQSTRDLYHGGLILYLDNSTLDARPYSLTGIETAKPSYNLFTAQYYMNGPLNIPHLMPKGPNLSINFARTRNRDAQNQTGLVPTLAQRNGDLPTGNVAVSPQAAALLALYPLPNVAGNSTYNYQLPILSNYHQDSLDTHGDKSIGHRDQIYGHFAIQSNRSSGASLFGFIDTTDSLGVNSNLNWSHRLHTGLFTNLGYGFSRSRNQVKPYFANRIDIEGEAGITGSNQEPTNWGPPTLVFSSGISGLYDQQSSFTRNRTDSLSASAQYYRGHHNVSVGGDFRRQEGNYLSQQDPRGTFTFTGAATGVSDFADFLAGVPDTSSIAYGNADKYLRQSVYDAYFTDDWRLRPELTINAGLRWEYGAPITELKNRLVNLDVASGFSAVAPVLASAPTGRLTGQRYPNSLLRPDRLGIEPRIGLSWRPIPASSLVVRAGYGVYDDTSVYRATALNLAQQSPLSNSLSVQNSATCPQTLASGFNPCSTTTPNTFAVDPNFRVGYAQTWQLAVQRDLPFALQMTATYLGIKGTRGVQEFLPNTYPAGATNPCPVCPVGFVYRTSGGNSTRESGSLQLRRRLRSGFTATLQYTYAKSIDDDSVLGGQGPVATGAVAQASSSASIAQDWLNLRGERAASTFDQRHLLNATIQYTSGMGLGGGTLLGGWRGRLLKEWTVENTIVAGTGLPETPVYLAIVNGTGFTGSIRPDRTSAPLYAGAAGHHLNANAFTAPQAGQWGNAGRDSITGPGQFTFNTTAARTIRLNKKFSLDLKVTSNNVFNRVVYSSWNTTLNPILEPTGNAVQASPLFGVPTSANAMRTLQTVIQVRF